MERSHEFNVADKRPPIHVAPLVSAPTSEPKLFLLNSTAADEPHVAEVRPPYDARALDLVVATLLLILVFPLMCVCAVLVLATSRGPLLFRHPRIGRNGEMFDCLKLRTMVEGADRSIDEILSKSPQYRESWQAVHKLKGDPRVTPVGAWLRRYCLDELPQLFNVLAGQMSIVGPRPIVAAEAERYGAHFALYCSVKPGLTGLWQISGRHLLSYPQRVELDAAYARARTLPLDVVILLRTIPVVLWGANE